MIHSDIIIYYYFNARSIHFQCSMQFTALVLKPYYLTWFHSPCYFLFFSYLFYDFKIFFLLLLYNIVTHGTKEHNRSFRISSHGVFRGSRIAASHVQTFLLLVPDHCVWKPAHHPGCQLRPHLHTPMYFFLSNLSFVDICFTCTTIPKMLWNIQIQSKGITYEICITQMYFFTLFVGLDIFLLTMIAYDPFAAICHPLHYIVIMNLWLCALLVLLSWIISLLHALLESIMVLQLSVQSSKSLTFSASSVR